MNRVNYCRTILAAVLFLDTRLLKQSGRGTDSSYQISYNNAFASINLTFPQMIVYGEFE